MNNQSKGGGDNGGGFDGVLSPRKRRRTEEDRGPDDDCDDATRLSMDGLVASRRGADEKRGMQSNALPREKKAGSDLGRPSLAPPRPRNRRYYAVRFGYDSATSPPAQLRSAVFLRWEDARPFVCGCPLPSRRSIEHAAFDTVEEAEEYLRGESPCGRDMGAGEIDVPPDANATDLSIAGEAITESVNNGPTGPKPTTFHENDASKRNSADEDGCRGKSMEGTVATPVAIGGGADPFPVPEREAFKTERDDAKSKKEDFIDIKASKMDRDDAKSKKEKFTDLSVMERPQEIGSDPAITRQLKVWIHHGNLNPLPPDWTFSRMTSLQLIVNWLVGDQRRNIPPLYLLNSRHVKHLHKMKSFMSIVEQEAKEKDVWVERAEEWDCAAVIKMWGKIKDDFSTKYCKTNRRKEAGWSTVYNNMSKTNAFGNKRNKACIDVGKQAGGIGPHNNA